MAKIGDVQIVLSAQNAQMVKALDEVSTRLTKTEKDGIKLGNAMTSMGDRMSSAFNKVKLVAAGALAVVGVNQLAHSLNQTAEQLENIGKTSARLKVGTDQISALRHAAMMADVEFGSFAKMAAKASINLTEMVNKGANVLQIGRVKVQLTDAAGRLRSIVDLIPEISRGMRRLGAGEQLNISQKIFGREGGQGFIDIMRDAGTSLERLPQLAAEAKGLNVLFSDDQIRRAKEYNDSIKRMQEAWLGVKASLLTQVAPTLTAIFEATAKRLADMPGLVKGTIAAIKDFTYGDDAKRQQALAVVSDVRDSLIKVLTTTFMEGGKTLGVAFIETLKVGMSAIAPTLEDVARDAFAPVINPVLKFSGENPIDKSLRGQLADAQKKLEEYNAALTDVIKVRVEEFKDLQGERGAINKWIAERRVEMADRSLAQRFGLAPGGERVFAGQVEVLRSRVQEQTTKRNQDLAGVMTGAFDATAKSAAAAKEKIDAAVQGFDAAKTKLMGLYQVTEESTAKKTDWAAAWGGMGDSLYYFGDVAKKVGITATDAFKKIESAFKSTVAFQSDMMIRRAAAGGDDRGAERMRMMLKFQQEQTALVERMGSSSAVVSPMLAQLEQVQRAELAQFNNKPLQDFADNLDRVRRSNPAADLKEINVQFGILRTLVANGDLVDSTRIEVELERLGRALDKVKDKIDTSFGGKLRRTFDSLGENIKNFGQNASETFADMALDGKNSIDELIRAFERMAVVTAAQNMVFGPIFNAIGGAVGSYFGSTPSPTPDLKPGESGPSMYYRGSASRDFTGMPIGGSAGVVVNVIDQSGGVQVKQGRGQGGQTIIDILVPAMDAAFGSGKLDKAMKNNFGIPRTARY